MLLSLILHPEILLGKGKTSVSKKEQSLQLLAARARAITYALHPSPLLCWLPFSSASGKSHSDLRKVVFWTLYSYLAYHLCLIKKGAIKIPPERGWTLDATDLGRVDSSRRAVGRHRGSGTTKAPPCPCTGHHHSGWLCPVAVTSDHLRPACSGRLQLALAHGLLPGQGSVIPEDQSLSSTGFAAQG